MTNTTAQTLPVYPTRPDSVLLAVPGTADYSTADGRWYVRRTFATAFTADGYEVRDERNLPAHPAGLLRVSDLMSARRAVADSVDREHRQAQLAYTTALAASDAIWARRVERMRESAAVHGRVTGSVGAYFSESDPRVGELVVFVERAEYAALLRDEDVELLDENDRPSTVDHAWRVHYAIELADAVAKLLGDAVVDGHELDRHALGDALLKQCPLLSQVVPEFD